jgi:thioester reductase-like protein
MGVKKNSILLTGATGLIGSYLLSIFLLNGHKVYALVRDRNEKDAKARLIDRLGFWNSSIAHNNLSAIVGDITDVRLGLNSRTISKVIKEIDEVFHCAAITNINWPYEKIQKVNVEGTQNVFDLAYACINQGGHIKVNHLSTAYLYGDYEKEFSENELKVGQQFKNTYERSKFEAEKLVGKYRQKGLWIDIFRPSIVIGESRTGKIFKFKNMYQLIDLCKLNLFDVLPLAGAFVNLVPIDLTSKAIYIMSTKTVAKNKTYHPFPLNQIPIDKIIELGSSIFGFKKPSIVPSEEFKPNNLTPSQKLILQNAFLSTNFKCRLISQYTNDILRNYKFVMPHMNLHILSRILRYYLKRGRKGLE